MNMDIFAVSERAQRRTRVAANIAGIIAAIAGVALVAISGWFLTGAAIAGASGIVGVQAFNYLLPSAGIRGLAIARTVSRYFERLQGHRAALLTLADLRPRLFAVLAHADLSEIAKRGGGMIASQLGSDVEALEDLAIRRIAVTSAAAGALAGLCSAVLAGPNSAFVLATGLGVTLLGTRVLAPQLLGKAHRDHGEALQSLKAQYAEYASCSIELALYGQARQVSAILEAKALDVDRARVAIVRGEGLLQGLNLTLASLTIAGVLTVARAPLPIQALAALAGAGAFEAMNGLTHSLLQRSRVKSALERLAQISSLPPRGAGQAKDQKLLSGSPPSITFQASGLKVMIATGGRIRLSGPSGSGKSRLVESLVGLRRDAPQKILIEAFTPDALGTDVLRDVFAFSAQAAPMIAGTLADNMRLARPGVSEEEMWAALETACLADTVRTMPDGLDTWLGTDGARLSGGQRKRLSLARALLAQKPWLVLDEPSEGLDAEIESLLSRNLDAWLRTTATGLVLVNHRPGLDWLADEVLFL